MLVESCANARLVGQRAGEGSRIAANPGPRIAPFRVATCAARQRVIHPDSAGNDCFISAASAWRSISDDKCCFARRTPRRASVELAEGHAAQLAAFQTDLAGWHFEP